MTDLQVFDEEKIRFEFDPDQWLVIKWDDSAEFIGATGIRKLNGELTDVKTKNKVPQGTKGVDFVGIKDSSLYLFEVKDFRGYTEENAYRQEVELPLEVGLKVRDTVAGLVGAHRLRSASWTEQITPALIDRARQVYVVAWIVEDRPRTVGDRRVHNKTTGIRTHQLQARLSWLTKDVWADDPLNPYIALPGVQAHTIRAS